MVAVNFDELSEAFDFVSADEPTQHEAYIDRRTGKIFGVWKNGTTSKQNPERWLSGNGAKRTPSLSFVGPRCRM